QGQPNNPRHHKNNPSQAQPPLDPDEPVPLLMESVSADVLLRDQPERRSEEARHIDTSKSNSNRAGAGYDNDRIDPTFSDAAAPRAEYASTGSPTDSGISPNDGYGSVDDDDSSEYWHPDANEED